jgi:hypothetical protein
MAVQQSLGEPAPFRVEGTEFAIVANMSTHENGNAGFSFLTASGGANITKNRRFENRYG